MEITIQMNNNGTAKISEHIQKILDIKGGDFIIAEIITVVDGNCIYVGKEKVTEEERYLLSLKVRK